MLDQLKQRNVHRVALAYLAGAWLLIQVVETLSPDVLPAGAVRASAIIVAIGFIPALVLAWFFEWTPEGIRREIEMPAGAGVPQSGWLDRAIVVTLVVAVGYFAVDKFVIDPARDEERIEVATTEAVEDALAGMLLEKYAGRSVLVLPFLNMSADEEQEYFADGISEELLNLLAKIEELRVISRSTSWTFKGTDIDVAEVQEKLNVSHILEGSVRKAGNQVRITAQLIDARTDSHLWSETYDRTLDDIFAIQDEISAEVVDKLKLELLAGPPTADEIDPVAYDLYLRGKHLTHTVRAAESFEEAVEVLSRAVELAPDYVPAIWELARAVLNTTGGDEPDVAAAKQARVRALVDRMVELAPDSSYANGFLGLFAERERDLQAAALYKERAIAGATDSNLYLQQSAAAAFFHRLGRFDKAAALAAYAVDRDPACSSCVNALASTFRRSGRHREGAEHLEKLLEWHEGTPSLFWNLGVGWLVAGEPAKALEYFEKAPPGNREMGRLLAFHDLGRRDEFNAELERYIAEAYRQEYWEAIARVYAWTGQKDLAFEYLDRAIDQDGPAVVAELQRGIDLYEPITDDPRWSAMLERYDMAEDDLARIRFNPKLPAEVEAALAGR